MTPEQSERAGLFVLGLLDAAEAARFEAEMARDQALQEAVDRLRDRFTALDGTATPVVPSAGLWSRIEDQIEAPPTGSATIVPLRRRQPQPQWLPLAASVLLALGIGYGVGRFGVGEPEPVMIAVLVNDSDSSPGAIVEAFADDSVRLVPLDRFEVPAGQIMEVWTLPDPQTGPVSLGTFSDPRAIELSGPDLPPPHSGQLYEITLEPAPGSPTGRPTGPILVKGFAKAPQT